MNLLLTIYIWPIFRLLTCERARGGADRGGTEDLALNVAHLVVVFL